MLPNFTHLTRLTAGLALMLTALAGADAQDYMNLSATDAARLIREGKISSQDLVTALLKQIDSGSDLHACPTRSR